VVPVETVADARVVAPVVDARVVQAVETVARPVVALAVAKKLNK